MEKMLVDLKNHESEKQIVLQSVIIEPLDNLNSDLSKFRELVEGTVDLDMAEKGEYVVRADFDESLSGKILAVRRPCTFNSNQSIQ